VKKNMLDVDEGEVKGNMGKGKSTDVLPPSASLVLIVTLVLRVQHLNCNKNTFVKNYAPKVIICLFF